MDKNESKILALYKKVYSKPAIAYAMEFLSVIAVAFTVGGFLLCSFLSLLCGETYYGVKLLSVSGCAFFLLSVYRSKKNASRPYEVFDFEREGLPRVNKREGNSFPSRHVFSAFLIGTLLLYRFLPIGIVTLVLGLCLGACRVLLGIHFLRDVVWGAFLGAFAGGLGLLLLCFA